MKRYTPSELRGGASFSPGNKTIANMLRQAADDAERLHSVANSVRDEDGRSLSFDQFIADITAPPQGADEMTMTLEKTLAAMDHAIKLFTNDEDPIGAREMICAREFIDNLSQPQPVAQGEFSVQVTAERMEEVINSMQGPDGEACAGTLWVGRLDDRGPDGSSRYGIHISCNECPEEGSVTLAEFDAPKVVAQGEAVASREIAFGWRPLMSWALGTIDELNEGPMTADQWGEDAGLYQSARGLLEATPIVPTGHRVVPTEAIDHEAIAEVVEEMLSEHPTATSVHEQNEDWADRLTRALQGVKDV